MARSSAGKVTISEEKQKLFTCVTARPNIEQIKFITEQQQIVVKSRGNHGPATVQLFDTRHGKEKARIEAYKIHDGKPGWATGMED
ncbi:MAG: hypothetical protein QM496_07940 [Verrucomicrobiota bacterium]